MANLKGGDPFLKLQDMNIDIIPGFDLTDQIKATDAANIIHAAYAELMPSGDINSSIATKLAGHSIVGAAVAIKPNWIADVAIGAKTQSSVDVKTAKTQADFPIFYVSPGAWRVQYTLPSAQQIGIQTGAATNIVIDWGDGSSTPVVSEASGEVTYHMYFAAGSYEVKITGTSHRILFSNQGCERVTAINAPLQGVTGITSLNSTFSSCTALTTIPVDVFRYLPDVTDFLGVFNSCNSLPSLPPDLFKYNLAATDYAYAFFNCFKLALRSDIFGTDYATRFLNKSINFNSCFTRGDFTGIQGVAPEVWSFDFGSSEPNVGACFGGIGNSLTSLSNYASIPSTLIN